jgi:dTDP-4-dehydrorhamnose reductase
MKILILGGSGQLGKSLLEHSWDRSITLFAPLRAELDVLKFKEVFDYILRIKPECVINATAWTDVVGAETEITGATNLNVSAVGNLANICKDLKIPLIHVSTDYVFDGLKGDPYLEDDLASPQTTYGRTKLEGEEKVISSGIEKYYIIRTSWLYSKFGKNFVKTIASKGLKNEPISIVDDQFGSPTFAGDLASGIASIVLSNLESGIYHFTNSGRTNWYEFGRELYAELGADVSLVTSRKTGENELKRPKDSTLDLSKWSNSALTPIYEWRTSLRRELPDILKTVERELNL